MYAVSRLHFGMYKSFNDLIASKYTTDGTSPCMFPGQEEVNTAGATITGSGDYDACLATVRKYAHGGGLVVDAIPLFSSPQTLTAP